MRTPRRRNIHTGASFHQYLAARRRQPRVIRNSNHPEIPPHEIRVPEIVPPRHQQQLLHRSQLARFFNPWIDLANTSTDDTLLAFKIESVTRTFGVVAALICSLSAAALTVTPSAADDEPQEDCSKADDQNDSTSNGAQLSGEKEFECSPQTTYTNADHTKLLAAPPNSSSRSSNSFLEHHATHVAGTSLLLHHGMSERGTADFYVGCCAASFYSSVSALGLSAVLNAWVAATPVGGARAFLRYHSLAICVIPGLLAVSTGLSGLALAVGLDRSQGTPLSYIGLGGTVLGGLLIGTTTVRGMVCTYRLLTPLVV